MWPWFVVARLLALGGWLCAGVCVLARLVGAPACLGGCPCGCLSVGSRLLALWRAVCVGARAWPPLRPPAGPAAPPGTPRRQASPFAPPVVSRLVFSPLPSAFPSGPAVPPRTPWRQASPCAPPELSPLVFPPLPAPRALLPAPGFPWRPPAVCALAACAGCCSLCGGCPCGLGFWLRACLRWAVARMQVRVRSRVCLACPLVGWGGALAASCLLVRACLRCGVCCACVRVPGSSAYHGSLSGPAAPPGTPRRQASPSVPLGLSRLVFPPSRALSPQAQPYPQVLHGAWPARLLPRSCRRWSYSPACPLRSAPVPLFPLPALPSPGHLLPPPVGGGLGRRPRSC